MYPLDQLIYDLLIAIQSRKKRVQLSPLCKEADHGIYFNTRNARYLLRWLYPMEPKNIQKMERLKRHRKVTNITNSNIKPLPTSSQC